MKNFASRGTCNCCGVSLCLWNAHDEPKLDCHKDKKLLKYDLSPIAWRVGTELTHTRQFFASSSLGSVFQRARRSNGCKVTVSELTIKLNAPRTSFFQQKSRPVASLPKKTVGIWAPWEFARVYRLLDNSTFLPKKFISNSKFYIRRWLLDLLFI